MSIGSISVCIVCKCFSSERILEKRIKNCFTVNGKQAIKVPEKDNNVLRYNSFHKQLPVPFVICTDFEAITKKYRVARQTMIIHTPKPIKPIVTVVMGTN